MGFWKGVGNVIGGTLSGVGHVGIGAGKLAGKASKGLGGKAMSSFGKNPAMFAAAMGTSAVAGYALQDLNGENPRQGAIDGAAIGTAAAVMGGSSAVVGLGAATVGAGVNMVGAGAALASKSVHIPKNYSFFGDNDIIAADGTKTKNKMKVTKTGAALLGAGLAVGAVRDMGRAYEKSRMGQSDGMMHTARPNINTAGATGELVFAMHKQR